MKIASAVVGMESSHQNISVQQSSLRLGIRMKKSEWEASQEMDREGDVQKDPQGEDKKEEKGKGSSKGVDLFNMTKEQSDVFNAIMSSVGCGVEMKTGLITITVTEQDPLICATIADSVRAKLQDFITEYRTNKARNDVEYYKKLTLEAKHAYEKARKGYGSYADQNTDVVMQSYRLKENDLENDMQLKFNTYSAMRNQLQLAEAKLQERTPAFTVIQRATVPQTPAGPKRMLNILIFMIFTAVITGLYVCRDLIANELRSE